MKETIEVGTIRVERPDGRIELRPYFKAQGASDEPYPHDATDEETYERLLVAEAKRRSQTHIDKDTNIATQVAIERSMITALREKDWTPE